MNKIKIKGNVDYFESKMEVLAHIPEAFPEPKKSESCYCEGDKPYFIIKIWSVVCRLQLLCGAIVSIVECEQFHYEPRFTV